jgi:hypothetical protein
MAGIGIETDVVELTKWGMKWVSYGFDRLVHGSDVHQAATGLLAVLEKEHNEPGVYLERHEVVHRKVVSKIDEITRDYVVVDDQDCSVYQPPVREEVVFNNVKVTKRIAKRCRTKFATALAKQAYLKFGKRDLTPANEMVTRKWLVKYLEGEQYRDMRTSDKLLAVDRALFLSFIPTMVYNNTRVIMSDSAPKNMMSGVTTSFGRIFSVRRRASE